MKQLSSNYIHLVKKKKRDKHFSFRAAGGQIKRDYEYRLFEGGKYDDKGFLIKNFPLHAVVSNTNDLETKIFKLLFLVRRWYHINYQ
jgi:hypothetical protein